MTTEQIQDSEKIAKREGKSRQVIFSVSTNDYSTLERAAEAIGLSVQDYCRHCVWAKVGLPSVFGQAKQ